jgi:hypothetical protein
MTDTCPNPRTDPQLTALIDQLRQSCETFAAANGWELPAFAVVLTLARGQKITGAAFCRHHTGDTEALENLLETLAEGIEDAEQAPTKGLIQ